MSSTPNQLQTKRKEREKEDLMANIEDLKMTIMQLTEVIETLKAEIAEMQVQLKRTNEDRQKAEHRVPDDRRRSASRAEIISGSSHCLERFL